MSQRSQAVSSSSNPRSPTRSTRLPWALLFAGAAAALWFSARWTSPTERASSDSVPPRAAPERAAEPTTPAPAVRASEPQVVAAPKPAAAPSAPAPAAAVKPSAEAKPPRPAYDPVTEPPLLRNGDGVRVDRTWGNTRDLPKQFGRHGRAFQTTSIFRYAAMAAYFFQEAPERGFPTKIGADGVIRIYDPGSNTYGEYNPDGTTRTFLRPERGAEFWAEQPGTQPISP